MELGPNVRLLYAWWVLLFAASTVLCLAVSLFSLFSALLWHAATATVLAAFSILFAWYLPARLRSIRYTVTQEYVMVTSGVLGRSQRYLYLKNVQFSSVERSVFDAVLRLHTVRLRSAGASLALHGLDDCALTCLTALLPGLIDEKRDVLP